MSHQDLLAVGRCRAVDLRRALLWLLGSVAWSGVAFRSDCTWTPQLLASVALLWSWSDEATLTERFFAARRIAVFLFPRQEDPASSYQAFMKLLGRWTPALIACLQAALQARLQTDLAAQSTLFGFLAFGVDGSKADLPRTRSNELAYAASRPGKKKKPSKKKRGPQAAAHTRKADTPQMWITTLWQMATGLPWTWRTGPADSSERSHLLEMLASLPAAALIAADAGFVGYDYAKAILDGGRHYLVRVGSNVTLLKTLGYARENNGTVYLWPERAAQSKLPPIVMRLVVVHNGRHPVYLVTSVLSKSRLSDAQVAQLYARRWGIELFYRSLKQTFGRRKLRSGSADNARVELEWSLMALGAMALYALIEATRHGIEPTGMSLAGVLRAFRRALRDYRHPQRRGESLLLSLRRAVIDSYERGDKSSRDYPRKKQDSPPGPPQIKRATRTQIMRAQSLRDKA
jgi:hypothetical protein